MSGSISAQNAAEMQPSPQQTHWQDLEFGVIVHFGTNTFLDREWGDGKADPKVFNPDRVDPAQWARASRAAGAKYMVMVAKHHDGFALWPTDQSNYSVKSSPWLGGKGDLVRMASDAARKEGMEFGIYLSPWDRHEPRYANTKAYDQYYLGQMDELVQNYGPLTEWWLDGAGSAGHVYDFPKYLEELRTYQSNAMVFADMALFEYGDIRWVGTEDGHIRGENWNVIDRHGYQRWRPVEVDTPLHKLHWFWHPNDESTLKSVDELMEIWENSVGRGGQLMLGIAPDRHGLLPDADVARLEAFGKALQARYGAASNLVLKHASADPNTAKALDGDRDTFWSAPEGSHNAMLEVDLGHPVTFDRVLSMEWLDAGQHIRKYAVEIWDGHAWKAVAQAEAIGHMKIDAFPAVTAQRVRLNILSSAGAAHIREFQLFNTGVH
ncbi:alpha-L-fucosidase [Dyella subtropica]|uniref:alpha-L-fucosidase n=1 Tax=Dyella subtropica TaxID=2992127 RepID=UPI0022558E52|nr:alpha-L-fucosidase [Dyella subtropica]